MQDNAQATDLTTQIGIHLPFLRRYARALTGSQNSGDKYAIATLEAILEDALVLDSEMAVKTALFKAFHAIWQTTGAPVSSEETGLRAEAQRHLSKLTTNTREALLLHTVEEFTFSEVAKIMQIDTVEAEHLIKVARQEMEDFIAGSVLIIEDEAIIAMDLETLVADMGHRVTGVARTRASAHDLAKSDHPDLILADIQLADNSSGIDAVNDILSELGDRPVIFITAFPERLLTGDRPEPAFLISKPYTEDQVRSAVSQAMFFSSTETLKA
ncbi:response regulator [Parasulfitobacter algicola]|uniref:Response regulator n=1 Tax=Parasulfitobacter algicola TaxID=2614809 RepID=A0ABX2IM90_9RHOB|nr:response regulator [Sulfitobacter algicola]NSX54002.1 response regulator [Sulfitobacter algicola]